MRAPGSNSRGGTPGTPVRRARAAGGGAPPPAGRPFPPAPPAPLPVTEEERLLCIAQGKRLAEIALRLTR